MSCGPTVNTGECHPSSAPNPWWMVKDRVIGIPKNIEPFIQDFIDYIYILFHFQASKFSMYVGIAISTLPTGIATVPDKHAHFWYSPQTQPYTRQFHKPIIVQDHFTLTTREEDLTKQGRGGIMIWSYLVDHPLMWINHHTLWGGATFMASVFHWYRHSPRLKSLEASINHSYLSSCMDPKWFKLKHVPHSISIKYTWLKGSRHRLMCGNHLSSVQNLQCHSMSFHFILVG